MKTAIILLLALAPFAVRGQDEPDTKVGAYVNVDGIVLGLVFDQTTFDAANYVNAVMVLSNASPKSAWPRTPIPGWDILDTGIGDYIVTDANGKVLPKVVWALSHWPHGVEMPIKMGNTHFELRPGAAIEFPGDIVRRYSLTNPGVYQVKAIARVPRPSRTEEMVIETPPITITVTPSMRPADNRDIYTPEEVKMIPELTAIAASRPPLKVTHRPAQASAPPQVETPKEVEPVEPVPRSVANFDPIAPISLAETATVPRSLLYYGVPLVVGGLGLLIIGAILWRSRSRS